MEYTYAFDLVLLKHYYTYATVAGIDLVLHTKPVPAVVADPHSIHHVPRLRVTLAGTVKRKIGLVLHTIRYIHAIIGINVDLVPHTNLLYIDSYNYALTLCCIQTPHLPLWPIRTRSITSLVWGWPSPGP
jgi:hypothetical protein